MGDEKKSRLALLNSPLSLLIAGFLLTTIAGSFINKQFHDESWKSKARFEIFRERLNEATQAQDSIIVMSNKRINLLWRMHSELEEGRLQSAREIWRGQYFPTAREWNNNVKSNKNRIELLFGVAASQSFLDDAENREEDPKSLHHIMRRAHGAVLAAIECMKRECNFEDRSELLDQARERLDILGLAHDEFSKDLRTVLQHKEQELMSY